jgi:3-oxoacyl-[acyl-carrier-protein] synthase II
MMGHSLGAAGAVEAVFCLLALQHQFLPSNINFTVSDDDLDLSVVANETRSAVLRTVLSNSFGFGGTNASILMRSFKE